MFCNKCLLGQKIRLDDDDDSSSTIHVTKDSVSKVSVDEERHEVRQSSDDDLRQQVQEVQSLRESTNHENSTPGAAGVQVSRATVAPAPVPARARAHAPKSKDQEWQETLRRKKDADRILDLNGFVRARVTENGHSHASVKRDGYYILATPRDGHCLFHTLLAILRSRVPDSDIRTMEELREALAKYFEDQENELTIRDDDGEAVALATS